MYNVNMADYIIEEYKLHDINKLCSDWISTITYLKWPCCTLLRLIWPSIKIISTCRLQEAHDTAGLTTNPPYIEIWPVNVYSVQSNFPCHYYVIQYKKHLILQKSRIWFLENKQHKFSETFILKSYTPTYNWTTCQTYQAVV